MAAWAVVIEAHTGWGDRREWRVTELRRVQDLDEARAAARDLAHQHRPEHPTTQRNRLVLRRGADEWLVYLTGATKDFHFRVGVWEVDE